MEHKTNTFNINNFIKMEHTRLSSLAVKRDLSLGGNRPRREYTPNLNVARNKDKSKDVKQIPQQTRQRLRLTTKQTKNGLRNKEEMKKLIQVQSTGLFSDGVSVDRMPRIYTDRCIVAGRQVSNDIDAPRITRKWTWENDVKEDDKVLNELIGGGEENLFPESNVKRFIIKSINKGNEVLHNKIYDNENPGLCLIKLPPSLPGKAFDEHEKQIDYKLSNMVEGKIGTIKYRKSGKIEMCIGNISYQLDQVQGVHYQEDLLCMMENKKSPNTRDIVNIGSINEMHVLIPNMPLDK